MISVNRDLLKDTKDVVNAPGPLCSKAEHTTLQELRDSTLSKSIADLALRVSLFFFYSLLFSLVLCPSGTLTYLFFGLQTIILEIDNV